MVAKKRSPPPPKKQPNEKQKLMFFVTCKKCGHKFGCEPRFVLMYLKRIYTWFGNKGKISEAIEEAQKVLESDHQSNDSENNF